MTRWKEKKRGIHSSTISFSFLPPESYISVERAVDRREKGKGKEEVLTIL